MDKTVFLELYNRGLSDRKIAEELGCSYSVVRRIRLKLDLPPNPQGRYRRSKIPLLDQVTRAYIAGFIDGEATIDLLRSISSYRPKVEVYNTNREIIEYFKNTLRAGHIAKRRRKKNHNTCYSWYICNLLDVFSLLSQIVDYLKVKKEVATLVLRFCYLRLSKTSNTPYSDEERQIFYRVRELNRRGPRS